MQYFILLCLQTEAEESLQKETDVNTQTNEVSPAPNYSSDR